MASKKSRKLMRERVAKFQKFVATYTDQKGYEDYDSITFTNDMLYGIGLALDDKRYFAADGYREFLRVLKEFISNEARYRKAHKEFPAPMAKRSFNQKEAG